MHIPGFSQAEGAALLNGTALVGVCGQDYGFHLQPGPAALWLFGSGLIGLLAASGRNKRSNGVSRARFL